MEGLEEGNQRSCCRDTTKKPKKLPFDKQKEPLNTHVSSLAGQKKQNSRVPDFLGITFNLWRFKE